MLYYLISTKAVRHFCRTALLFRLYLNRLHTRNVLLQPQEIRFIEMPRYGAIQHNFYRIAFLPLEIDLAHGDFPLCQPVIQTHKFAFAVCQTDRKLGHLHFFSPLDTAQQHADSRNKQMI